MAQLDWDDLSRGQKLETIVVCLVVGLSAIFVLKPILAGLHPMFAGDIGRSRLDFLLSPSGIAIIVYSGVLLVSYSYIRYREYW